MYKTLQNLAVLLSSNDFFSYTGNLLLIVLRMEQNAGPLEHQYGEIEITRNRPKIEKP